MASKKKPNIVFITYDSGRPDHLGYMGYKKNVSPFLDALAKKGTYFTRAFATGPGSPHSFVAIFTSTHPFDYGGFAYIDRPRVLLSEVLKKHGYTTVGIHSAVYMSSYFGYDRGWDKFLYLSHFKGGDVPDSVKSGNWRTEFVKKIEAVRAWIRRRIPWADGFFTACEKIIFGLRKIVVDITDYTFPFYVAEEVNDEVKKALPRKPEKPLFLWVHYMDTHSPYALFTRRSKSWFERFKFILRDLLMYFSFEFYFINRFLKPLYLYLYDASIRYVDEHIKKLFEHLKSIGVIDNESIVIVCADHGEEFFERKRAGHSGTLFNVNLNIPLIFHGLKNVKPGTAIARPISLIDLGPTVLEIAGLPKEKAFKGRSFFDETERPIIGQIPDTSNPDLSGQTFLGAAVIYRGYKLIHMIDKKMLFSVEDDFDEKIDLYEKEKEIVERLEKILKPYEFIRPNK